MVILEIFSYFGLNFVDKIDDYGLFNKIRGGYVISDYCFNRSWIVIEIWDCYYV